MVPRTVLLTLVWACLACQTCFPAESSSPSFAGEVLPLLRARCVKCHGPAKREAKLDLSQARGLVLGGENGAVVDFTSPLASLLWRRIAEDEMPPEQPLSANERQVIERWLKAGAEGLPRLAVSNNDTEHWAFRRLVRPQPPEADGAETEIDRFLLAELTSKGLSFSPRTDRYVLVRRLCFDLTGLPPSRGEIEAFVADPRADAYERLVDRFLASPHYGERWGKWWLDAAGYADSNGYFNADTDRPLAYRYRDYVVASFNADKPFDQFVREQLAGDELAGYQPGAAVQPEQVELLVATHFLRNAQDGTGESDGNPDEVRADRYSVLEGTEQIIGSCLLGLTLQCARCHDHKFEPISQRDYYSLQAILGAAFDPDRWIKPNEREVNTATPEELAAWEARARAIDVAISERRREFAAWVREQRPHGRVLFEDHFDAADQLAAHWSNSAPGDDSPAGASPVVVGGDGAPAAVVRDQALQIVESSSGGNRWLSTVESFDWAPAGVGATMQVTFDLVADQSPGGGKPADRIGYYVSLHDYDDNSDRPGGNVLFDGNPAGGAAVHVDYPGADSRSVGQIGAQGYQPGHNYGVRITNSGEGRYLVEHLVDGVAEEKTVTLERADLTGGGFGFEFCCGRSFIVDNVVIEAGLPPESSADVAAYQGNVKEKRQALEAAIADLNRTRTDKPGRTAVLVDVAEPPSDWHLLVRGNYGQRGEKIEPGVPAALSEPSNEYRAIASAATSGRRLALARWLTGPNSRAASLLARVTVNRVWQQHFGVGICATPDNLGFSGSPPSHPDLLDYLACELIDGGWSMKRLQRAIVLSTAYRQSSRPREEGLRSDPDNRLLWRFPLQRLDAESVRDAALAIAGQLDTTMGGRYVPTHRNAEGEVVVDEGQPGATRRSLYLQHRRTQMLNLLEVYDAPSLVYNCTRRSQATIPLQSLSLLNSVFAVERARALARRLAADQRGDIIRDVFLLVAGRPPRDDERAAAERFLQSQPAAYAGRQDAADQALADFCQMLLASNAFLYVE
ncbi:MAG TPA: PSD1 and planctomycete cytochrome C domain-containing protein [Pirellulales bacterium]|nr:PSD1 and planctomycete cytochrome C domain-containing protein [Pirellulales bacterium]